MAGDYHDLGKERPPKNGCLATQTRKKESRRTTRQPSGTGIFTQGWPQVLRDCSLCDLLQHRYSLGALKIHDQPEDDGFKLHLHIRLPISALDPIWRIVAGITNNAVWQSTSWRQRQNTLLQQVTEEAQQRRAHIPEPIRRRH